MINLEQVKLLETKVAKAIDYIQELSKENAARREKEAELQATLESYQNRINELEILVMRFKEDQSIIEDSILAALDRLNQFEESVEKCLWDTPDAAGKTGSKSAVKSGKQQQSAEAAEPAAGPESDNPHPEQDTAQEEAVNDGSGNEKIYFEIQETEGESDIDEGDIVDPLEETQDQELQEQDGELDIF